MRVYPIVNTIFGQRNKNANNTECKTNLKLQTQPKWDTVEFKGTPKVPFPEIYERMLVEINNMLYGHRPFGFHSPEGYCNAIKNFDIDKMISMHGESVVFTMKNPEHIFKISCAPYEPYIPEFHAPEIERGIITTPKKYPIINMLKKMSTDTFFWVIQKRGKMFVSNTDQQKLVQKVIDAGYEVHDLKYDQFAYFGDEAKFVDLGCVTKKGEYDDYWHRFFKQQEVHQGQ